MTNSTETGYYPYDTTTACCGRPADECGCDLDDTDTEED